MPTSAAYLSMVIQRNARRHITNAWPIAISTHNGNEVTVAALYFSKLRGEFSPLFLLQLPIPGNDACLFAKEMLLSDAPAATYHICTIFKQPNKTQLRFLQIYRGLTGRETF
jgi:hypothetical protein